MSAEFSFDRPNRREAADDHLPSTIGESPVPCRDDQEANGRVGDPVPDLPDSTETADGEGKLVEILDRYLAQLRDGKAPSREELIARHPSLAEPLEACLAGLEFIHRADCSTGSAPQQLGDFRLLREIGRGGMGVVYEAEQVSLQRRVAVKVLRFGAISDPEAIDRFRREAETVARLHHTNIVPIFYVGIENGVNYYAMEFIDGRSLADVLADSHDSHGSHGSHGSLDAMTVLDWGCQAAEALAHAHQRGVIHRDVKPSNLLLDAEGRIWLTDFGLAKRLDDVTLSMTGALLGTPRYMSPEQASAARHRLDHRTDLYSLGATLYELLTGQPVFSAETPHQVIDQILNREPTPPRQLAPSLPRDVETLLLKCLVKEPGERYASARELADDLHAVLEGRPIRARRTTIAERTTKWLKRHRRSLTLTGGSVAATAALFMIALLASLWYRHSQIVPVMFTTDQAPLAVELHGQGDRLVAAQTVPTQEPMNLSAGTYRLRVSGKGRLSEDHGVVFEKGDAPRLDLHLDQSLLGIPREIGRSYQLVPTRHGTLAILLDDEGLRCVDLRTDLLKWTRSLQPADTSQLAEHPGWIWPWHQLQRSAVYSGWGAFDSRPFVVASGSDIDGDGTDDLLLAARHQAFVLAISGSDGGLLWVAARGHDLEEPIGNRSVRFDQRGIVSGVIAPPLPCGDVDGDGVSDVAVLMIEKQDSDRVTRWLETISGQSGQRLWRRELEDRWFLSPAGLKVPEPFRWFFGSGTGTSSFGGNFGSSHDPILKRENSRMERTGYFEHAPGPPSLLSWHPGQTQPRRLTLLAGSHLLSFDVSSGEPTDAPLDCGMTPGRAPTIADVDGDGADELVLMQEVPPSAAGAAGPTSLVRIGVFSLAQRKLLWSRDVLATWPQDDWPQLPIEAAKWPVVTDLNQDGRCELMVPNGTSRSKGYLPEAWGELEVLDAVSGKVHWKRRLKTMDQQVDRFLVGPDINQDGTAEVFVATLWSNDFDLYVDALSGENGQSLGVGRHRLGKPGERVNYRLGALQWWQAGRDGWPQLVIPLTSQDAVTDPLVCLVSAGTGNVTAIGSNLLGFRTSDADGDGIEDLFAYESRSNNALDAGGRLLCFRGPARERWNDLGRQWSATADLDGDGGGDLIRTLSDGSIVAASSVDGQTLWRAELPQPHLLRCRIVTAASRQDGLLIPSPVLDDAFAMDTSLRRTNAKSSASSPPQPANGDLDGDGTRDLLVYAYGLATDRPLSPVLALSGRNGRWIWSAEWQTTRISGVHFLDTRDLDGDGAPEVIWVGTSTWDPASNQDFSVHRKQMRLVVLSGRSGRLLWEVPLTKRYGATPQSNVSPTELDEGVVSIGYGDLNDDGVLDLVVPAETETEQETRGHHWRAVNGKTGEPLWASNLPPARDWNRAMSELPPPILADLDGDKQPEIVTLVFEARSDSVDSLATLSVLDGRDGRERWRKSFEIPAACGQYAIVRQNWRHRPRPMLLNRRDGSPWISLNLGDNPERVLVVDGSGNTVSDFRLETVRGYHRRQFRMWACDTNGDGNDELVLTNRDRLMAIAPQHPDQCLWERDVHHLWTDEIEAIVPADGQWGPRLIVRRSDAPASLYAVDAASGQTVWTSPIPSPRRRGNAILIEPNEFALLREGGTKFAAEVFFRQHLTSRVLQATETMDDGTRRDADGSVIANVRSPRVSHREPVRLIGGTEDPRMERRLPWVPPDPASSRLRTLFLGTTFYGLALAYLPVWFLWKTFRRRRWGLKWLAMLPLVVAIALVAMHVNLPDLPSAGLSIKLILAANGLPIVFAASRVAIWFYQRRWRRIAICSAAVLLMSVLVAIFALLVAQTNPQTALQSGEYFVWEDWWWILGYGLYLTACLGIAAMLLVSITRPLLNRLRREPAVPTAG